MTIDIPDEQLYTIPQLAEDLKDRYKWTSTYCSSTDDVIWDIAFTDRDGKVHYMTLDGMVYDDGTCAGNEEWYEDYRDVLSISNLVWVYVPRTTDPYGVVGIIG